MVDGRQDSDVALGVDYTCVGIVRFQDPAAQVYQLAHGAPQVLCGATDLDWSRGGSPVKQYPRAGVVIVKTQRGDGSSRGLLCVNPVAALHQPANRWGFRQARVAEGMS